jgi:hypothetical protein
MSRGATRFDQILEQVGLLTAFLRVLRGDDPEKVKAQHEAIVSRTSKLKEEIEQYAKPPERKAPDA